MFMVLALVLGLWFKGPGFWGLLGIGIVRFCLCLSPVRVFARCGTGKSHSSGFRV